LDPLSGLYFGTGTEALYNKAMRKTSKTGKWCGTLCKYRTENPNDFQSLAQQVKLFKERMQKYENTPKLMAI
jgi:hypothetical protein